MYGGRLCLLSLDEFELSIGKKIKGIGRSKSTEVYAV